MLKQSSITYTYFSCEYYSVEGIYTGLCKFILIFLYTDSARACIIASALGLSPYRFGSIRFNSIYIFLRKFMIFP